jgi:phosphatidylglycerophosphate synthase
MIYITCGKVVVRPRILGKVATVFQMVTVLWLLLKWNAAFIPSLLCGVAIFTSASFFLYAWDGLSQMSKSPSSLPKPEQ